MPRLVLRRDIWIVVLVFVLSMSATLAAYRFEHARSLEQGQVMFERAGDVVHRDLVATLRAYAQFLRAGSALFRTGEDISRQDWSTFVRAVGLEENYPGTQGVSFNRILRGPAERDAFQAKVRATDWPNYTIVPPGDRELYTAIAYMDPMTNRNERAIGFDISSEANRSAAVQRAVQTGLPTLTQSIKLVQEAAFGEGTGDVQPGVLLVVPVYRPGKALSTLRARSDAAMGVVVGAFRMGDLLGSVLQGTENSAANFVDVSLSDASQPVEDSLLYQSAEFAPQSSSYISETRLSLYGQTWVLNLASTPRFEELARRRTDLAVLLGGLLVSLLLTSLAWAQAARARESRAAAAVLKDSHAQIELLMGEVNHRSKNLLSVVQAIARQTSRGDPATFSKAFSQRLGALSANQDLLVRSGWKRIEIHDLVHSQLSHLEELLGQRISVSGPSFGLGPKTAQTLGMALHELATNAIKYGALSNDTGKVTISWTFSAPETQGGTFAMSWLERDGPAVKAPSRKGFGSKVTSMMVRAMLLGDIRTSYDVIGFEWHLSCPAENVLQSEGTASREANAE
ncbi:histidine kinase [Jannaschia pagri]|uniref:histidine kinase n=2 Tax=Jannaschia pagri TaxID=2829797 RepID=A0ABQ4NK89_9RHOB|nr:CHASE domain-containing protein [Jannaschia sp. AI_61]GIT91004.1 histidine kinase [Jannaschia sp. AI_61]GIT94836.1 histidine kinase [Jannaschia sp. AI_62]